MFSFTIALSFMITTVIIVSRKRKVNRMDFKKNIDFLKKLKTIEKDTRYIL